MSATVAYLVRHGRTELNAIGSLRGLADVPLDEAGLVEAERLGELFAGVAIDGVFTSPLARARATAGPIAEAVGVDPLLVPRFADRDYGPWNGVSRADVESKYPSVEAAPGVEPRGRFAARVLTAFEVTVGRSETACVIVAHEAVNRLLLARVAFDAGDDPDAIPQRTGCWNRLESGAEGWTAAVIDAVPGDGREA
jgi:broad specificity phosphatase PhoE